MAEFLADMSLYLPVPTSGAGSGSNVATFLRGTKLDVDVVDSVDDFQSVIDGLADNLSSCAGITKDHSHHLHMARFLYATYLRRQPLLLAGLNAEEIVQILSATVRGQYADVLTCTESYDEKTAAESMKGKEFFLSEILLAGIGFRICCAIRKIATNKLLYVIPTPKIYLLSQKAFSNISCPYSQRIL